MGRRIIYFRNKVAFIHITFWLFTFRIVLMFISLFILISFLLPTRCRPELCYLTNQVAHVRELSHHWFKLGFVAYLMHDYGLKQGWGIINRWHCASYPPCQLLQKSSNCLSWVLMSFEIHSLLVMGCQFITPADLTWHVHGETNYNMIQIKVILHPALLMCYCNLANLLGVFAVLRI